MTTRVGGGGDFRWILDEDELLRGSQVYSFIFVFQEAISNRCVYSATRTGGERAEHETNACATAEKGKAFAVCRPNNRCVCACVSCVKRARTLYSSSVL